MLLVRETGSQGKISWLMVAGAFAEQDPLRISKEQNQRETLSTDGTGDHQYVLPLLDPGPPCLSYDVAVHACPNLAGRIVQTMEIMHQADDVAGLDQFPAFEHGFVQAGPWGGGEAFWGGRRSTGNTRIWWCSVWAAQI